MKEAGIGAAFIGNINPSEKDGKVPLLSEDWWNHMVHAVNEGKRIGVDIGSFNCPGWSQSGGPWVTSDKAMRYLNYSETTVTGGKTVKIKLVKPKEEFQDVYVLAFSKDKKEDNYLNNSNSKITITPSLAKPSTLLDEDTELAVIFTKPEYIIDIKSNRAITARSIKIYPGNGICFADCDLQIIKNGKYVSQKKFRFDRSRSSANVGPERYAPVSVSIPAIKTNQFRLVCNNFLGERQCHFLPPRTN